MAGVASRSVVVFLVIAVSRFGVSKSWSAQSSDALHHLMTEEELAFYLGVVTASAAPPEYQVVFLTPPLAIEGAMDDSGGDEGKLEELKYDFTAFDTPITLRLQRNRELLAPSFTTFLHDGRTRRILIGGAPRCHFLHRGEDLTAALSLCGQHEVRGVVLLSNETLQISPLSSRLRDLLRSRMAGREALEADEGGHTSIPHLVRRAPLISHSMLGDALPLLYDPEVAFQEDENPDEGQGADENAELDDEAAHSRWSTLKRESQLADDIPDAFNFDEDEVDAKRHPRAAGNDLTLELAVFFDETAYRMFAPFLNNDETQMRDMLLAYMNAIQALYVHPSLQRELTIAIVRLELFSRQPSDLPTYGGERGQLLDSFCAYSAKHNPGTDKDPAHWDMGLYVSGLDFFAYENGRQSGVTMGLATVGGVCTDNYACVIAEFGTVNQFGKPYPSAGFTSVYVSAHEIGHNLGMHHDSSGNSCPKEGYVMSPSRGTNGETQWSSCSADVLRQMEWAKCLLDKPGKISSKNDHGKFRNIPGQFWGAKRQCEVLLRDKDATLQNADQLPDICVNLRCKTPHRSGFYFAGPALEGTPCGNKLWCSGGACVPVKKVGSQKPITEFPGGWSKWKEDKCTSGCTTKSQGYQTRRRACDNPKPVNTEEGCEGPSFDVTFCKDDKICKKRITVEEHASERCKEFSKLLKELDPNGSGLQAPHEDGRLWMACSVFCKRKDTGAFYTPRLDLNDLGVDPYFPDGTLCHNDGKKNYYCLQHHCLPEDFKDGNLDRQLPDVPDGDVGLAQNAGPKEGAPTWGEKILKYLTLGKDGRTLLGSLGFGRSDDEDSHLGKESDWEDKDYREVPH